jgi:diguanylate cyclase (GGDEF)-like protein/PAS domain S-box-containing protein
LKQCDNEKLISIALRDLLKTSPDFVIVKNMDLQYVTISDSVLSLLGIDSKSEIVGKTAQDFFADKTASTRFDARDKLVIEGNEHIESYEEFLPLKGNNFAYIAITKSLVVDEDGDPIGIIGLGHDRTKAYQDKLVFNAEVQSLFGMEQNALLSLILDLTTWRVLDSNYRNDIRRFCYNMTTIEDFRRLIMKVTMDHPEAERLFHSFDPETLSRLYKDGKREYNIKFMINELYSGEPTQVRFMGRVLLDPLENHLVMVIKLYDLSDKTEDFDLLKAAEQDSMTCLFNHEATLNHIANYLEGDGHDKFNVLMMIDVDNFKGVNDNYGHQVGDEVLIRIASIIKHAFRSDDIVGRVGGDEFMVLMKDCGSIPVAEKKAVELVEALQFSFSNGVETVEITCSVGVGIYDSNLKTLDQLYYEADAALYKSKASGKKSFTLSDTTVSTFADKPQTPATSNISAVHLKTLLENMDGSMVICCIGVDDDIAINYVSPSMFKSMGRNPEELGNDGHNIPNIIHDDDVSLMQSAVIECAHKGTGLNEFFRVWNTDGETLSWWHARGSRLPDDGDGKVRLLIVISDVTAIMAMEQEQFAQK